MTGQQAEKRSDLLRQLGQQVESLTSSAEWVRWMETAAKFHTYSFGNQLLILRQYPDATQVAGYRKWQSMGRQVRKGERGIAILAPMIGKAKDSDDEDRVLFGFKIAHVFDLAQTDGEPLPAMEWPVLEDGPEGLADRLALVAKGFGLDVEYTSESPSGARGWYEPSLRRITIVDTLPAASQARTMLHELAHSLDPACVPGSVTARAEKELVAESVAYIVGKRLGLATDHASTFYTATWGAEPKKLEQLAERVLTIAEKLEAATTEHIASTDAPSPAEVAA